MSKLDFIKWLYEATTRLNAGNPTYFKYWMVIGTLIITSAVIVHILIWQKVHLPGFILWLDDGWFAGFGSGVMLIASLTMKKDSVSGNIREKLPLTSKKDGI